MITFSANYEPLAVIKGTQKLVNDMQKYAKGNDTSTLEWVSQAYISLVQKNRDGISLLGYAKKANRGKNAVKPNEVPLLNDAEMERHIGVRDIEYVGSEDAINDVISQADTQADIEAFHILWEKNWLYCGVDIWNLLEVALTGNVLAGQKLKGYLITEDERLLIKSIVLNATSMEILKGEYHADFFDK